MVSRAAVDSIVAALRRDGEGATLAAVALRSRVGKGACQGAFCSARTIAHLHERGDLAAERGLDQLGGFLQERWRGQHPVLWGEQIAQAELAEAVHCGLFAEELRGAGSLPEPVLKRAGGEP